MSHSLTGNDRETYMKGFDYSHFASTNQTQFLSSEFCKAHQWQITS